MLFEIFIQGSGYGGINLKLPYIYAFMAAHIYVLLKGMGLFAHFIMMIWIECMFV